ncbi:MAG: HAD-IIB family hydrolase [Betaproteobacteria bacterium]|nr:HAD-IIB family hydrolase [Betaproteobacteria bacterium]
MRPLAEFPLAAQRRIRGVLCDIDDTLTTGGRLTAPAYAAMEALQRAGLLVIPITGRPAGWCDHIARMWPVDAVVGENGAFYFRYATRKMVRRYMVSAGQRAADRVRLVAIRDRILAAVPGCAVAADQHYREADLAIDYCEDVPRLPPAAVDKIVSLMQQEGLTAKVSSIHVNGWFGAYDKLAMTKTLMCECFDVDLDARKDEFVFAGDSPNDAPMFAYFPHAVGVANIRAFSGQLSTEPAYMTQAESGAGFCELVDFLLAAR